MRQCPGQISMDDTILRKLRECACKAVRGWQSRGGIENERE